MLFVNFIEVEAMDLVHHDSIVSGKVESINLAQDKNGRYVFDDPKDKKLAQDMLDIKEKDTCAAMAAPQYGHFKRMFVWRRSMHGPLELVVNPKIIKSDDKACAWNFEGSFTAGCEGIYWIKRPSQGDVSYWTLDPKHSGCLIKKEERLSNFEFRVFQHECDLLKNVTLKEKSGQIATCFNDKDPLVEKQKKQRNDKPWSEVEEFEKIPQIDM